MRSSRFSAWKAPAYLSQMSIGCTPWACQVSTGSKERREGRLDSDQVTTQSRPYKHAGYVCMAVRALEVVRLLSVAWSV